MAHDPLSDLLDELTAPAPVRPAPVVQSPRPARPAPKPIQAAPTGTRYLVARAGRIVNIRAFDSAEHPRTTGVTKRQAWDRAQRLAVASPSSQDPLRRHEADIVFTDLQGERHRVAVATAH